MLYIDPDTCIDCGACVPECPVEAIYEEGSLPAELEPWLAVNAEKSRVLPVINQKTEPLWRDKHARSRQVPPRTALRAWPLISNVMPLI